MVVSVAALRVCYLPEILERDPSCVDAGPGQFATTLRCEGCFFKHAIEPLSGILPLIEYAIWGRNLMFFTPVANARSIVPKCSHSA